jgi:hypothetical protein
MGRNDGVDTTFMPNIANELDCLANANLQSKGACIYTKNYVQTCELTTKQECQTKAKSSAYSSVNFNQNLLCTATGLNTNCVPTTNTECDDQGNVRFIDNCGDHHNQANIYDSSKTSDKNMNYWTTIQEPTCTTSDNLGSKNSPSCGSCDYYSSSMCRKKTIGDTVDTGNYLCKSLDCVYTGQGFTSSNPPKNGETWCTTDNRATGTASSPGASSYRMMCFDGEVTSQECDTTRQLVCSENSQPGSGFKTANCNANLWFDCALQDEESNCTDIDKRDCKWIQYDGFYFFTDSSGNRLLKNETRNNGAGMCVPSYPTGFDSTSTTTAPDCGYATSFCFVKMQKGLIGSWYCNTHDASSNCSCLYDAGGNYDGGKTWATGLNDNVCTQLGDCGNKINYIGQGGNTQNQITMQNVSKQ